MTDPPSKAAVDPGAEASGQNWDKVWEVQFTKSSPRDDTVVLTIRYRALFYHSFSATTEETGTFSYTFRAQCREIDGRCSVLVQPDAAEFSDRIGQQGTFRSRIEWFAVPNGEYTDLRIFAAACFTNEVADPTITISGAVPVPGGAQVGGSIVIPWTFPKTAAGPWEEEIGASWRCTGSDPQTTPTPASTTPATPGPLITPNPPPANLSGVQPPTLPARPTSTPGAGSGGAGAGGGAGTGSATGAGGNQPAAGAGQGTGQGTPGAGQGAVQGQLPPTLGPGSQPGSVRLPTVDRPATTPTVQPAPATGEGQRRPPPAGVPWWFGARRPMLVLPVAGIVALAIIAMLIATVLGGDGGGTTEEADTSAAATVPPEAGIAVTPGGAGAATTPAPTATATGTAAPQLVSGTYRGTVQVKDDPAGHSCCVKPADQWTVYQGRADNVIFIRLSDILPGVSLQQDIPATGTAFTASTTATVAGFANTSVTFSGTVTPAGGVLGTLTVGENGRLPQGKAITFDVKMSQIAQYQGPALPR